MTLLKKVEKANKALLTFILSSLLSPKKEKAIPEILGLKDILLIRQDERLGNLVMLTPFLTALKSCAPRAKVTLLAGNKYSALFKFDERVDELLTFPRGFAPRSLWKLLLLLLRLRSKKFDLAFDLSHAHSFSVTNALLLGISRGKVKIGYKKGLSNRFCNRVIEFQSKVKHETEVILDLLRAVYPVPDGSKPQVFLPAESLSRGKELLMERGFLRGKQLVGIHPGGRGDKLWMFENFMRIGEELRKAGVSVFFFVGRNEIGLLQKEFREGSLTLIQEKPISSSFPAIQPSDVLELASIISHCSVFVSGDSGPMHLAVSLGVPTVTVFLVENHERYGYSGERNRVLWGLGEVRSEEVLAAIEELLKQV